MRSTPEIARNEMTERNAEERKCDFAPVSEGFTCDQASCETGRCLQCDLRLQLAPQRFWNDYVAVGEEGGEN